MPRPEFELVVAQAPKKFLFQVYEKRESTLPGNVNATETVYVYGPENHICHVISLMFSCQPPASASSGEHRIYLSYDLDNMLAGTINIDVFTVRSKHTDELVINSMYPTVATEGTFPNAESFPIAISSVKFDHETPCIWAYHNRTNAAQQNVRHYAMTVIAEEIAGAGGGA